MSKLYFKTTGNPSSPALIFLHADTLDHRQWDLQIADFAQHYFVVSYDLSGFGQSPMPTTPFSHQQDLFELMQSLHLNKATLVGSSYGGEHAINFCLEHSKMVKALVLVDTSLSGFPCTVDWNIGQETASLETMKQNWLNHQVFSFLKKDPQVFAQLKTMVDTYSGSHWYHRDRLIPLKQKSMEILNRIQVPTLVMVGENDLSYFHQISQYIIIHITGSQLIEMTGVSHRPNLEAPALFNQLVMNWINKQYDD